MVFHDISGNSVHDSGEVLANITVTINGPGGPYTLTTNASGAYNQLGLTVGCYRVTVDTADPELRPSAALTIGTSPASITLTGGDCDMAVFGLTSSTPAAQPPPTPIVVITDPLITKSVNPPFSMPGESAQWTIVVTNPGSIPYGAVQTVDNMPAEVEIVNVKATVGTISFSGQTVTWNIGSLAPLQSVTITIDARVQANVAVPFTITNVAVLTGDDLAQTSASAAALGRSDRRAAVHAWRSGHIVAASALN